MKYRRINIFGGPGVGKSICAAKLFGDLKLHGYLIEQVSEYAKTWAHQKRSVDVYAQLYFLAKQVKAERECLTNGYELIVTDSPLGLCPFIPVRISLKKLNGLQPQCGDIYGQWIRNILH